MAKKITLKLQGKPKKKVVQLQSAVNQEDAPKKDLHVKRAAPAVKKGKVVKGVEKKKKLVQSKAPKQNRPVKLEEKRKVDVHVKRESVKEDCRPIKLQEAVKIDVLVKRDPVQEIPQEKDRPIKLQEEDKPKIDLHVKREDTPKTNIQMKLGVPKEGSRICKVHSDPPEKPETFSEEEIKFDIRKSALDSIPPPPPDPVVPEVLHEKQLPEVPHVNQLDVEIVAERNRFQFLFNGRPTKWLRIPRTKAKAAGRSHHDLQEVLYQGNATIDKDLIISSGTSFFLNGEIYGESLITDPSLAGASDTNIASTSAIIGYIASVTSWYEVLKTGNTSGPDVATSGGKDAILSGDDKLAFQSFATLGVDDGTTPTEIQLTAPFYATQIRADAFDPGTIPFADPDGFLATDDTNLLWDTSKDQLLIGTSSTSGFQKTHIVSNEADSTDWAALALTASNSGSGIPYALSSVGVLTGSYTTEDAGADSSHQSYTYVVNDAITNSDSHYAYKTNILHNGDGDLTASGLGGGLCGGYEDIRSNSSSGSSISRLVGRAYSLGNANSGLLGTGAFLDFQLNADGGGDITEGIGLQYYNDTGAASVLNHYVMAFEDDSNWVNENTLPVQINGFTRYIPTYDQPISDGAYSQTFTSGDLVDGVLPIEHALDQGILFVVVTDDSNQVVVPSEVTFTDSDNVAIDLGGLTVDGTWTALVSIGNPATGANVSILDPTEIEIFSAQGLLDASDGTGTITVDGVSLILTFKNEDTIFSPVKIVAINGATVTIQGTGTGVWAWNNVGTFITSTDSTIRIRGMSLAGVANLSSPFSATFIDFQSSSNTAYTLNVSRCNLLYWVGGTHDTGVFLFRFVGFIDWFGPIQLTNSGIVEFLDITIGKIDVPVLGQTCIEILSSDPDSVIKMTSASGRVDTGDYFLRVDPLFSAKFLLNGIVTTGTLFNTTGDEGTFTAITDATITAQALVDIIDSPTNPGTARYRYTGDTVYTYQKVTASTSDTDYDVTDAIVSLAGNDGTYDYFEIDEVDYDASGATGSFDSDSIILTTDATTLSDGDTVLIDGQYSIETDGGTYAYNVVAGTTFQINAEYPGSTAYNGTWNTSGLDERNPRVLVTTSPGNKESAYRAYVHIEDNSEDNDTTVVDGEYNVVNVSGDSAVITGYVTNGAGGTTVTSNGHALLELQNVTITDSDDDTYNAIWTVINVTTNTFDISVAFSTDPTNKGSWNSGPIVGDSMERFKLTDPTTMAITYVGREDRSFTARTTGGAYKQGAEQEYQFANALNEDVPQGGSYEPRPVSPSLSDISFSQDFRLTYGDTITFVQTGKGTSTALFIANLRQEIS